MITAGHSGIWGNGGIGGQPPYMTLIIPRTAGCISTGVTRAPMLGQINMGFQSDALRTDLLELLVREPNSLEYIWASALSQRV